MAKLKPYFDYLLHLGANAEIFKGAGALRNQMTQAENVLLEKLRNRQFKGYKFRRQHPLGKFIADFYCHQAKLVIEVDGGIHSLQSVEERDIGRSFELEQSGIKVLRFTNDEVFNELDKVLLEIEGQLLPPHPR